MNRLVRMVLLFGGLAILVVAPADIGAQSKKQMSKETTEIGGAKSAIFEHWKKDKVDKDKDKDVLYKFDLGKPKDMEKLDTATLTVVKVKGTDEEIFSSEKQVMKDDKATVRGPDKEKIGPFETRRLYMVGTPPDKKDRFRLVSWVLDTKDGKVLVRLWGPSQLLGIHQPDIDQWLKAFK
jgi:hypothetical protein